MGSSTSGQMKQCFANTILRGSGELLPLKEDFVGWQKEKEKCNFHPVCGTVDQLHILCRVLEIAWEFTQLVQMCFFLSWRMQEWFNRGYPVSVQAAQKFGPHCQHYVRLVSGACRIPTWLHSVIHNFYGQDFQAQLRAGGDLVWG